MNDSISHEGLKRLVNLELSRLGPTDPVEAHRILKGMVGAYDQDDYRRYQPLFFEVSGPGC